MSGIQILNNKKEKELFVEGKACWSAVERRTDGRSEGRYKPGLLALDEMPPRLWDRCATEAGTSGAKGANTAKINKQKQTIGNLHLVSGGKLFIVVSAI